MKKSLALAGLFIGFMLVLINTGCSNSAGSASESNIATNFPPGMYSNTLTLNVSVSAPGYTTEYESVPLQLTVNVQPDGTIPANNTAISASV